MGGGWTVSKNDNYHLDYSRVSNSMLNVLASEPIDFRDYFVTQTRKPPEASEHMGIGSATHCLSLEPDEFGNQFIVVPKGIDGRTKEGKAFMLSATEDAKTNRKTIIKQDSVELAMRCVDALHCHSDVSLILRSHGVVEERIDFQFCGVDMRSKLDKILISDGIILDIKTTKDVKPDSFKFSCRDFGYDRQAALYCEAASQEYQKSFRFLFAAVSTKPPHSVAVYELSELDQANGLRKAEQLLEEYKSRKAADDWLPIYSRGINVLELPRFGGESYLFEPETNEQEAA